jgi:quinohemoprotein ethanol dehydrogenase
LQARLSYVRTGGFCHALPGIDGGGNLPISAARRIADLDRFVFGGLLVQGWQAHFTGKLTANDLEKIKAFIQGAADTIWPK